MRYTLPMMYLLGIDIGVTKHHLRARPNTGRDVDFIVPSNGNLYALGAVGMVKELSAHVATLKRKLRAPVKFSGVAIGMSGLDDVRAERAVHRELVKHGWWKNADPDRRRLVNDIQIGMRAGTSSHHGIAIISGTGSNGYAIDQSGKEAWVSGRGMHMSDEGSGFWIGVECLRAVRKAEDGRGQSTKLSHLVFRQFKVQSTAELLSIIYSQSFGKRDLAELNILAEQAATEGDRTAATILDEAANELLLMAVTLHKNLSFGRDRVDTVLIGGTINNNAEFQRRFLAGARRLRWMNPILLTEAPVEGALKLLEG